MRQRVGLGLPSYARRDKQRSWKAHSARATRHTPRQKASLFRQHGHLPQARHLCGRSIASICRQTRLNASMDLPSALAIGFRALMQDSEEVERIFDGDCTVVALTDNKAISLIKAAQLNRRAVGLRLTLRLVKEVPHALHLTEPDDARGGKGGACASAAADAVRGGERERERERERDRERERTRTRTARQGDWRRGHRRHPWRGAHSLCVQAWRTARSGHGEAWLSEAVGAHRADGS